DFLSEWGVLVRNEPMEFSRLRVVDANIPAARFVLQAFTGVEHTSIFVGNVQKLIDLFGGEGIACLIEIPSACDSGVGRDSHHLCIRETASCGVKRLQI